MTVIASTTVRVRHLVRVEHALTGAPLTALSARLVGPVPPGWAVQVKGGAVLVTVRDGLPEPAGTPRLLVRVPSPATAALLTAPEVELELTGTELVHRFEPVPQTVTVVLVDHTGEPDTGRTVSADPGGGVDAVPLPELTDQPGTYRTAAVSWSTATSPFDLLIDGSPVRRLAVDPTRTDTRVHVVSTT